MNTKKISMIVFALLILGFTTNVFAKDCSIYDNKADCENNGKCKWGSSNGSANKCYEFLNIDDDEYVNFESTYVSCGITSDNSEALMKKIPKSIPKLIHTIYLALLIVVPILLVIFGTLDLFKGLSSQKEEEIKKGQQIFVKRLITAAIIFFVFVIVKFLLGAIADSNKNSIIDCVECFIEDNCD